MWLRHSSYTRFNCMKFICVSWDTLANDNANDVLKNNRLQVFTTLASSKNDMHLLIFRDISPYWFCSLLSIINIYNCKRLLQNKDRSSTVNQGGGSRDKIP